MPDVTQVQGGALGVFMAIILGAPQAGYDGRELMVLVAATALFCAAAVLADAIVRNGRAGIVAAEYQGLQANVALVTRPDADEDGEG